MDENDAWHRLSIGSKVLIKTYKKKIPERWGRGQEKYMGQVMTIRRMASHCLSLNSYHMEEDRRHFHGIGFTWEARDFEKKIKK